MPLRAIAGKILTHTLLDVHERYIWRLGPGATLCAGPVLQMYSAGMRCPVCNGETSVVRTTGDEPAARIVRRRVCKVNAKHTFETEERPAWAGLSRVLVYRQDGHGAGSSAPFDRDRLISDLTKTLHKRITPSHAQTVVDAAIQAIEAKLPQFTAEITSVHTLVQPSGLTYVGAIRDSRISEEVNRQLAVGGDPVAHVLYALSTIGRADRSGRAGWYSAGDLLGWLRRQHKGLPDQQPRTRATYPVETWRPPQDLPALPVHVIRKDGRRETFSLEDFEHSVHLALLGRPSPERTAHGVVRWVLSGIVGQRDILSVQLSMSVMECLRRVDEIAYLRWAIVLKGYTDIADVYHEATGIIERPSPVLRFLFSSRDAHPYTQSAGRPAATSTNLRTEEVEQLARSINRNLTKGSAVEIGAIAQASGIPTALLRKAVEAISSRRRGSNESKSSPGSDGEDQIDV